MTQNMEPLLGWMGEDYSPTAMPLVVPASLFEPMATGKVVYSCNLPGRRPFDTAGTLALDPRGSYPASIDRNLASEFLRSSLAGGQVAVFSSDGGRYVIKFRWLCLTANTSIGSVWRAYSQSSSRSHAGAWTSIDHDYVFDAGGILLNPPATGELALGDACEEGWLLEHINESVTCFPCKSGLVKVTKLLADGRPKRELINLRLHANRHIFAEFSDGKTEKIAVAAAGTPGTQGLPSAA